MKGQNCDERAKMETGVLIDLVMEQHPTLPLVAVSGIDNTVKVSLALSCALSLA